MNASRVCLSVMLAAALAGGALAAEREVKRRFAVEPGCALNIDTHRGEIVIEESDASEIRLAIVIEADAGSEERALRLCESVQLDVVQKGNVVTVRARSPIEQGVRFVWDTAERIDVFVRVSVPRECDVSVRAAEASLTVGSLAGRMMARLERGTAFFRRITGTIDARVDFGEIIVSRCSGDVTARVLSGTIRTGTIGGAANLKNGSGDIEVLVAQRSIVADAEAGDVRVGFGPGISADSRVTVSGGNIRANIHADVACRVQAGCSWGRVTNRIPLATEAGAVGKRKLSGTQNGGGPLIALHASGGSVTLSPEVVFLGDR